MDRKRLAAALTMAVLALMAACGGGEQQAPPAATPDAVVKSFPDLEPQTLALMLRLTAPEIDLVTSLDRVSVSGVTSPDATLSVNGRLALPDAQGRFSISLERPGTGGPMAPFVIEVIATSIAGETESRVRPVIFISESESSRSGTFGVLTAVTPSEITLQTGSGPVTLAVDAATQVRSHGWESPSVSNIAVGTRLAVLADGQRAVAVLAVPSRPVLTRHLTGLVTVEAEGGSLTLRDGYGRQITAAAGGGLATAAVGELVTVVLEQDLATGDLTATAVDGATEGARRLFAALDLYLTGEGAGEGADAQDDLSALRWRLTEHSVSHLSNLAALDAAPLATAIQLYGPVLAKHRAGKPSAEVTGMVTLMDSVTGQITVQPNQGRPVTVRVGRDVPVALFGERVRSGQLDLASRVTVRYSLAGTDGESDAGMEASRVAVSAGNTLLGGTSARLALSAGRGEVQGILTDAGSPAIVTILDRATGGQISLITAGATVLRDGAPAVLGPDLEGAIVFARYDPDSHRLLELESINLDPGEELVSGVVHSFIPKAAPGNLTIRTPDGRLRPFTHDSNTVIRRDGLRVPISAVRTGDLVRPNTRVRLPDGAAAALGRPGRIVALSLKTPEPGVVTGIIRGVSGGEGGYVRITISDIWLELISLKVGPGVEVTQQGRTLAVADLAVGQEIAYGSYDPLTLVAGRIALKPPRAEARASLGR